MTRRRSRGQPRPAAHTYIFLSNRMTVDFCYCLFSVWTCGGVMRFLCLCGFRLLQRFIRSAFTARAGRLILQEHPETYTSLRHGHVHL